MTYVITLDNVFGSFLKLQREKAKFLQKDVSLQLNITQPAYSKIESGDTSLNIEYLCILAWMFNYNPKDFVGLCLNCRDFLLNQGFVICKQSDIDMHDPMSYELGKAAALTHMRSYLQAVRFALKEPS